MAGGDLNAGLLDSADAEAVSAQDGFMVWVNREVGGRVKKLGEVQCSLTETGIILGTSLLLAEDIAGLQDGGEATLLVHSFPQQRMGCFGGRERAPERHELLFNGATGEAEKARWLAEWRALWGRAQLKKVLVLVNPAGGRGKAAGIWSDVASKVFECAGVGVELVETTHQGHAQEFAAAADLSDVDGIVCVSGDGLLIEVINGLLVRSDSQSIVGKVPLGIIPAGSGNGLAMSLLARSGEKCHVISAALAIVRGRVEPLDVANVEQGGVVRFHSIISLEWGLPSDTDILADTMRWCGSVRFTLQGLLCIAKSRVYEGCIRILPPASEPSLDKESDTRPTTRAAAAAGAERGDQEWITLEGKFAMVWACNITHCVADNFTAPKAELSDGCLDVLVIRDGVPRSTILKMFLDMEKGMHTDYECLEYFKAREIVWEPHSQQGLLAIDGELVACGKETEGDLPASWKGVELPMEYAKSHVKVQQGFLRVFS